MFSKKEMNQCKIFKHFERFNVKNENISHNFYFVKHQRNVLEKIMVFRKICKFLILRVFFFILRNLIKFIQGISRNLFVCTTYNLQLHKCIYYYI